MAQLSNACTVCDGARTVKYREKKRGTEQVGDCYHCGASGEEPELPATYGEGNAQGWCRLCTVIGGGHRTACPNR